MRKKIYTSLDAGNKAYSEDMFINLNSIKDRLHKNLDMKTGEGKKWLRRVYRWYYSTFMFEDEVGLQMVLRNFYRYFFEYRESLMVHFSELSDWFSYFTQSEFFYNLEKFRLRKIIKNEGLLQNKKWWWLIKKDSDNFEMNTKITGFLSSLESLKWAQSPYFDTVVLWDAFIKENDIKDVDRYPRYREKRIAKWCKHYFVERKIFNFKDSLAFSAAQYKAFKKASHLLVKADDGFWVTPKQAEWSRSCWWRIGMLGFMVDRNLYLNLFLEKRKYKSLRAFMTKFVQEYNLFLQMNSKGKYIKKFNERRAHDSSMLWGKILGLEVDHHVNTMKMFKTEHAREKDEKALALAERKKHIVSYRKQVALEKKLTQNRLKYVGWGKEKQVLRPLTWYETYSRKYGPKKFFYKRGHKSLSHYWRRTLFAKIEKIPFWIKHRVDERDGMDLNRAIKRRSWYQREKRKWSNWLNKNKEEEEV